MNTIGPLRITACTLHVPDSGSWVLDVDHDLPTGAEAPAGKVTCMVGGAALVGTVDPTASGTFGTRARCRVVGAIEWRYRLPKRDYQNPAGVLSSVVVGATAAELGIPAAVVAPTSLGRNFVRAAGPASQVLGRDGWWVGFDGVTTVGPRPASAPLDGFVIQDFDALSRVARAASTSPVAPGLIIADERLGKTVRVREVTQTWGPDGAAAELWMGEALAPMHGPRLASAIQSLAVAALSPALLTHYEYAVVGQDGDGAYMLQADATGPVPDATPVVPWAGVPGFSCTTMPSSKVLVAFRGREPVVIGFDGSPPLSATWDFQRMNLGGDGAKPTANADIIDAVLELVTKVNAAVSSGVPYAGIALDVASIKASLATMRTRSA